MNNSFFSCYFSAIRNRFGYGQYHLASLCGISLSTYSRIESQKQEITAEKFNKYIMNCANLPGFSNFSWENSSKMLSEYDEAIQHFLNSYIIQEPKEYSEALDAFLSVHNEFSPGYFKYQLLSYLKKIINHETINKDTTLFLNKYGSQYSKEEKAWLLDLISIEQDRKREYTKELESIQAACSLSFYSKNRFLELLTQFHLVQTLCELSRHQEALNRLLALEYRFSQINSEMRKISFDICKGAILMNLNFFLPAIEVFQRLIDRKKGGIDEESESIVLENLAWIYSFTDKSTTALKYLEQIKDFDYVSRNYWILEPYLLFCQMEKKRLNRVLSNLLGNRKQLKMRPKITAFLLSVKYASSLDSEKFLAMREKYWNYESEDDYFTDYFFMKIELELYKKLNLLSEQVEVLEKMNHHLTCRNCDYYPS